MNPLSKETTQEQYPQSFMPSLQSMPKVASKDNTPEGDSSAPRKRTRASPEQLAVLEKTFSLNPSPNNRVREQLSRELGMSERSIQIWFQNRRAKVKNIAKRSSILYDETLRMQHYASAAATAACQAAAFQQQQSSPDTPVKTNSDLYYYYYYYYFNQQQQQQQRQKQMYFPSHYMPTAPISEIPPPSSLKLMPPPPPPPPISSMDGSISPSSTLASDMIPSQQSWARKQMGYQGLGRARAHTIGPYPTAYQEHIKARAYNRGASVELPSYKQTLSSDTIPDFDNHPHFNSSMPPPPPLRMTESPTSPDEMTANNFGSLSVNDSMDMSYQPLPFFDQPQQMNWSELPFYGDQTMLNTPTSMPDCNPVYYPNTTPSNSHLISAEALQVGTWKRMGFQPQDLSCFFDKQRSVFVWCIRDGVQKFKMEFSQDALQDIKLEPLQERAGWARLEIEVIPTQVSFYMEVTPNGNWVQCRDYTEDKQASVVTTHYLDGPALALRAELDQLVQGNSTLQKILNLPTIKPVSTTIPPGVEPTPVTST